MRVEAAQAEPQSGGEIPVIGLRNWEPNRVRTNFTSDTKKATPIHFVDHHNKQCGDALSQMGIIVRGLKKRRVTHGKLKQPIGREFGGQP